jgi:hypothetical protein
MAAEAAMRWFAGLPLYIATMIAAAPFMVFGPSNVLSFVAMVICVVLGAMIWGRLRERYDIDDK